MITWEAVTAISTALTTVVLVITVLMARRQLQLLRRSTQLDGLIKILAILNEPRFQDSYHFVIQALDERMNDPIFRANVANGTGDETVRPHLPILRLFEQIGSFVKFGLLDPEAVYCQVGASSVRAWHALSEVIRLDRERGGPGVWDGFETLVAGTTRYFRTMNPNFPEPYSSTVPLDNAPE